MWQREWSTLSGGEGQRIALAIAVGVGGAEVVLLDGECCLRSIQVDVRWSLDENLAGLV